LAVTGSAGTDLRPAEAAFLFSNAQERSSAVFAHAGRSTIASPVVETTVALGFDDAQAGAMGRAGSTVDLAAKATVPVETAGSFCCNRDADHCLYSDGDMIGLRPDFLTASLTVDGVTEDETAGFEAIDSDIGFLTILIVIGSKVKSPGATQAGGGKEATWNLSCVVPTGLSFDFRSSEAPFSS